MSKSFAFGRLRRAGEFQEGLGQAGALRGGGQAGGRAGRKQLAAMHEVREVADKLERIVSDNYWPLPKYSEMMFIK